MVTLLRRTLPRGLAGAACALLLMPVAPFAAESAGTPGTLAHLEIAVTRAEDLSALRKLQRAYGYYADRGLWNELADLFADDAVANYPSGGFDGKASIRAMFVDNLGQGKQGLAEGRIYNHTILQPVVDLAPDGATATGRWRVLGMLGRFGASATWADSLYRFDYVKQGGQWKIKVLTAYAGSGGGYADGWVQPVPRAPGAADRSPIRFNLAHPADRDWRDPCEADTTLCVVPFPYPNRGSIKPPLQVSAVIAAVAPAKYAAHAADVVRRAQRLADEQAVQNLQNVYGYYVDRGLWKQAAALFAPHGTREEGQAGVYVGRSHIRRALALTGPEGLRRGQLNDHLQIEPVIDVAADGQTAQGRFFELAFTGGGGVPARIVQNVSENTYVKRGDAWQILSMHVYTILATDYDQGWAKSALPAPTPDKKLRPDRPPTVMYEAYPKVFTPPLHAGFAQSGAVRSTPAAAAAPASERDIAEAERQVQRVLDWNEIENLQNAYGYYAEKTQWLDITDLFADDGVLVADGMEHAGHAPIRAYLQGLGPSGPVKGALDSQLQMQPVIDVTADGMSAKIRSRMLELSRDTQGHPMWGGGIYENELVKDNGIWKFRRLDLQRTYLVPYKEGWAAAAQGAGVQLPTHFTPPFHYHVP